MLIPNCPFPHKCRQILPKRRFDDPNHVSKKSFKKVSFNIENIDTSYDNSNCSNFSNLFFILIICCLILLK